jgi:septal ring factor EnvC (AmiA/AmiB activator)
LTGLTYLADVCNISLAEVARTLNVTRGTVGQWTGLRKVAIPTKHITSLIKLFHLPSDLYYILFALDMDELDKTKVDLWNKQQELSNIEGDEGIKRKIAQINVLIESLKKELLLAAEKNNSIDSKIQDVKELINDIKHNNELIIKELESDK